MADRNLGPARAALLAYTDGRGVDRAVDFDQDDVSDLITDLAHLADEIFNEDAGAEVLSSADRHYDAETLHPDDIELARRAED